jgi:hypothetical protein
MIISKLLTTMSYPDRRGTRQELLESQGGEIVRERGRRELETKKCPA